jgi:hypothetical protein
MAYNNLHSTTVHAVIDIVRASNHVKQIKFKRIELQEYKRRLHNDYRCTSGYYLGPGAIQNHSQISA